MTPDDTAALVHAYNEVLRVAHRDLLPFDDPIGLVQWVPVGQVVANDYNPNSVAHQEMRLLHTSIKADGYTQPVVTVYDADTDRYVIVDGFHRYTVLRRYADINERTSGYLPVVVLDKPMAERMASTVRHNRARGKHSVAGMSSLVFRLLDEGVDDAEICNRLGLEAEELARLKHITGYAALHADHEYSRPVLHANQIDIKAEYKREHPDEDVPSDI